MSSLAKLRWQCRRGTVELDLLLSRYLEEGFSSASADEQAAFVELLSLEDDRLLSLLFGAREPDTRIQAELIGRIHRIAQPQS